MLSVTECSPECLDVINDVVVSSMGRYHVFFASECLRAGICRGLLVLVDGSVAGVGLYYKVETRPRIVGVIYYIAVLSRFRGLGLGKVLVASIEELAIMDNVAVLLATTRRENKAARRMFNGLGYKEVLLDELGDLSEPVMRLTCGYDDDLLFIKHLDGNRPLKALNALDGISFLLSEDNVRLINEVWFGICYSAWLRARTR